VLGPEKNPRFCSRRPQSGESVVKRFASVESRHTLGGGERVDRAKEGQRGGREGGRGGEGDAIAAPQECETPTMQNETIRPRMGSCVGAGGSPDWRRWQNGHAQSTKEAAASLTTTTQAPCLTVTSTAWSIAAAATYRPSPAVQASFMNGSRVYDPHLCMKLFHLRPERRHDLLRVLETLDVPLENLPETHSQHEGRRRVAGHE
jgi:hypothetical protein